MYRSSLSLGVAAFVAACLSAFEPIADAVRKLRETVRGGYSAAVSEAEPARIVATTPKVKPFTLMKLHACALAMIKRERPKYSPTWRMCPST